MLDCTQQRGAMIQHLESALGLAIDLGEGTTAFLIERVLDDRARRTRVRAIGGSDKSAADRREGRQY
jgi:hypothetical protein